MNNEQDDEITQLTPDDILEKAEKLANDTAELAALETKLKETEDKFLRTYAEFDNYRKRVAREKEEVAQYTTEKLLREMIEVKDHLELALEHSKPVQGEVPELKTLREGVGLTLKQLEKFLEKCEVQEVKALGDPFNPAYHEAIQQVESKEFAPDTVVQVFQKGYTLKNRLLRAARVTVSKGHS